MEVTRTFDILKKYQALFPKEDALAIKSEGIWLKISTDNYIENVNKFSYGLLALGFKKGDKIATISNNRPEWNIADMGMSQVGVVHVPVYPTISNSDYEYILEHCDAKLLIVSDKLLYDKLKPIADKTKNIEYIYSFNEIEGVKNWIEILNLGHKSAVYYKPEVEKIKRSISPGDLVSMIYTSGTTGRPKGVMLTHNNFITNMKAGDKRMPIGPEHKILSFLPLCHVYERLVNYIFQYRGISIYYAENLGTIIDNLKEIEADGFNTVPRLLEKVYATILQKGRDLKGIKKVLFNWALDLGLRYEHDNKNGLWYSLQLKIANKLVFSKWRAALGGQVKYIGCGGAALQPRLERIFWAAGIPIQQGYGLTETSPLIAYNGKYSPYRMIGSVGCIIDDVEVKIAEDGEILCKGPNVMLGYYKEPEMTKDVIDSEGWFHTGDIGRLNNGNFLQITDRKKELFKISSGKYIAPQMIENLFKESQFIEQLMVIGENEKFASALISPNFSMLQNWCNNNQVIFSDKNELVNHPRVLKLFQDEVRRMNKNLGKVEEIKKFRLVTEEWTPATGELSPTLKLKRKVIIEKYDQIVGEIYGRATNVVN